MTSFVCFFWVHEFVHAWSLWRKADIEQNSPSSFHFAPTLRKHRASEACLDAVMGPALSGQFMWLSSDG